MHRGSFPYGYESDAYPYVGVPRGTRVGFRSLDETTRFVVKIGTRERFRMVPRRLRPRGDGERVVDGGRPRSESPSSIYQLAYPNAHLETKRRISRANHGEIRGSSRRKRRILPGDVPKEGKDPQANRIVMKSEQRGSQAWFLFICILTAFLWCSEVKRGKRFGYEGVEKRVDGTRPMFRVEARAHPSFVQVSGTRFLLDGRTFHFAGANCYYMSMKAADPLTRKMSTEVFDGMQELGLTVLRTWAFRDGDRSLALQPSPGVYSEKAFQGLDWVVAEAGKRGIKLILSLTDYWNEFGGMQQYVSWSRSAQHLEDFYTDAWCKRWYKMYVAKVLNRVNTYTGKRYKDDSAIMAWELANEARNEQDQSGFTLQKWTEEMSAFVKSIDPFHLVTTGSEGFLGKFGQQYNPGVYYSQLGVASELQHKLPDIDYVSAHLWPDIWLDQRQESENFALNWMKAQLALAKQIRKPFVLGEFGKSPSGPMRESFFHTVYKSFLLAASKQGPAGGILFWMLSSDNYLDYGKYGITILALVAIAVQFISY